MSQSDAEIRRDQEWDLRNKLRTMLDDGLGKHSADELIEIIKELAVIAVADAKEEDERR